MAKPIEQLSLDLKALMKSGNKVITDQLPRVVMQESLNHFEESFDNQGFTDKTLEKWAPRKIAKSKKARSQSSGRAILVGYKANSRGTHLKDSLKSSFDKTKVVISTDKVYAPVHNEGKRAGRGKGFTMTKRQFMGASAELDNKIGAKLDQLMDNIFD